MTDGTGNVAGAAPLEPVVPQQWWRIRGPRAMVADRHLVGLTGWSYMAWQNCKLRHVPYTPSLLLTTIGRRSGLLRDSVLPYHRFGPGVVIIGSNSGGSTDPEWARNLRAESRCWFRLNRQTYAATARELEGGERSAALATVIEARPYAQAYEDRTQMLGRWMPVVLLEPATALAPQGSRRATA